MWWIDVKGRDVAQPIWLPGCFEKAHFIAKKAKNAFLHCEKIVLELKGVKRNMGFFGLSLN